MRSGHALWVLGAAAFVTAPPANAATVQVVMEKLGFAPAQVSAAAGDTIEWVNKDVMSHTATADGRFDVVIPPHKTVTIHIKDAGTYDYYCRFHPNMRGTITLIGQ